MATVEKDFKVKNGLLVTAGGVFGGNVTVALPTDTFHAATKGYVDSLTGTPIVPVEADAPLDAVDGQMYVNSTTGRISVFLNGIWTTFATVMDAEFLPQHIHDTSIGGTGLIASTFIDSGFYNDSSSTPVDAGFYDATTWTAVYDGGIATENFN